MRSARPAFAALLAALATALLGTAAADAAPLPATKFDAPGAGQPELASGDFDGDGIQDLATPSGDSELSVLPGLGGGEFGAPETIDVATGYASLAAGDFDADGIDDLVVVGRRFEPDAGTISVLRGTPQGLEFDDELEVDGWVGKPFVADLGSNAADDLVLTLGAGTKAFAGGPEGLDLDAAEPTSLPPDIIAVGDFGGEIGTALVTDTYDADGNQAIVWSGDLEAGFQATVSRRLGNAMYGYGSVNDALVRDLDGDGLGELMIAAGHPALGTRMDLFWGDPEGGLAHAAQTYSIPTSYPQYGLPGAIAVSDFDGDGESDVAVASRWDHSLDTVSILRGTGGHELGGAIVLEVPDGFEGLLAGADVLGSASDLAAPTTDAVSVIDIAEALADTQPPETSIDGAPYLSQAWRSVSVPMRSDDRLARFECALDGEEFGSCDVLDEVPEGSHSFAVRAIDRLGNVDPTPASVEFEVEWAPPRTSIKRPSVVGRRAIVTLKSDVHDSRFRCALDGGRLRPCGEQMTFRKLEKGRHTVRAVAIDSMGQRDETPVVRRFRVR